MLEHLTLRLITQLPLWSKEHLKINIITKYRFYFKVKIYGVTVLLPLPLLVVVLLVIQLLVVFVELINIQLLKIWVSIILEYIKLYTSKFLFFKTYYLFLF